MHGEFRISPLLLPQFPFNNGCEVNCFRLTKRGTDPFEHRAYLAPGADSADGDLPLELRPSTDDPENQLAVECTASHKMD